MADGTPATEGPQTVRVGAPMYGGSFVATAVPLSDPVEPRDVAFAIEGELVQLAGDANGPSDSAVPLAILERSPARAAPRCRHFGVCGGCQYQHMDKGEQLRTKASVLEAILERHGIALPAQGIYTHAADEWRYRNRMRLRLRDGRIGYSARRSNTFLPIEECPIVSPLLWRAAAELQALAAQWPTGAAEAELFATGDDAALQLSLHLPTTLAEVDRSAPDAFRKLCEAMRADVPELRGAGLLVQAAAQHRASRRVEERERTEIARWGISSMHYRVGAQSYAVSRGAFFQVNRFLTEMMVDTVLGGRSGGLALDLYAGAGLFSVALARRYQQVISCEIGRPAASDLQTNLEACEGRHRAEHKTTLKFLQDWNRRPAAIAPDLAVMDPPRAGLGREVVAELLKLNAAQLVYVSCDPTTFARDCRTLVESRYLLEELHLLDLFPQTFHLETIAVLRRR